jgi:hypothetical protein
MKRSLFLLSVFYFITAGISLNAQNQRPAPVEGTIRRQALEITIESRVFEGKDIIWSEINRSISMPGSPVGIQLVGSNIVVVVQFTPYIRRNDSVLAAQGRQNGSVLSAQGQIWIADKNNIVTYYTSMQTIPFELGEPIHFLPLGPEQLNPSIEIIITVNPYNENNVPQRDSRSQNNR